MQEDQLRFLPGRCQHDINPIRSFVQSSDYEKCDSETTPEAPTLRVTSILKRKPRRNPKKMGVDLINEETKPRKTPIKKEDNATEQEQVRIAIIGAAAYRRLTQDPTVDTFSITPCQLDRMLNQTPDSYQISEMQTPEEVKDKLPPEYHDFIDVFDRKKAEILPPHRPYDHKIEIEGEAGKLPKSRLYPISEFKLRKVKEYLTDNLKKGFITPSKAPYASPILFAAKKDGSLRFCVDYRKLNALTKRDRYPIPLIDEVLARVQGAKYLSRLDIIAAFNKLRMNPNSEDLTTFVTSFGAFKYRVLPFGLINGPASFQHYINDVLFEYLHEFCQAYLDDILIYSKTLKEHRNHVRAVLQKLREAGLQVDIVKCEFHVQETLFLGLLVSTEGLKMHPDKIQVIQNWGTPRNVTDVQSFIGFCNFYRRFIRNFSKIARPMITLTRKDQPFAWNETCQEAFNLLKRSIASAPILTHFDRSKEAILETDSSDYVNGGVLSQYGDDGKLHPVAFYSKNMAPAECNYEIYDKELLAIIRCLKHWRPELECTEIPIKIFTDHKNLEYFMTTKELTRRQARWAEKLAEFNFKILYQTGARNHKADALTRLPGYRPDNSNDDRRKHQQQILISSDRLLAEAIEEDDQSESLGPQEPLPGLIKSLNQTDDIGRRIREALTEETDSVTNDNSFSIQNKLLTYLGRVWVPESVRTRLIREVHDQPSSGHQGVTRTLEALRRGYDWPGAKRDIKQYIRNCHTCCRSKAPRDKLNGLLQPLAIPEQRWKDIAIDFITGLPLSEGYNAILTVVDRLTKERHYIPCTAGDEGTSAEETAKLMLQWVYRTHGLPSSIISDRGTQFVSIVWKSIYKRLRIDSRLSTAYHPQTDGQTERANQDVERYLRSYCSYRQDDWPTWLPMAEFADNNATSIATGMTPFFLNKGFHPRMSFDLDPTKPSSPHERLQRERARDITARMEEILGVARKALQETREAMATSANKKRKEVEYKPGDMVFLSSKNIKTARPSKKLDDKMLGPFKVLEAVGSSYRLQLPMTMKVHDVFHASLMRKAAEDPLAGQKNPPPPPVVVDDEEEWELEDIEDSRLSGRNKRLQYRVKWKGIDRDLEWYNADGGEFDNCRDLVEDFHARHPDKPTAGPSAAAKGKGPQKRGLSKPHSVFLFGTSAMRTSHEKGGG